MTGPRDWDKEMAEIDRLMKAPPAPSSGDQRPTAGDGAPRVVAAARPAPGHRPLAVWTVAALGPLGAAALASWPYNKACNLPLGIYLVGVLAVLGASVWTMRLAWAARRGVVMILGVLTLLAALTLALREVLPRIGYAATSLTWTCSS